MPGFSTRTTFLPGGGRLSPFAVRSRASGGYEDVGIPNVNNPVDVYKQTTGSTSGQHTSPQFGNQPAFDNRLSENLDLHGRAQAFDQRTADQERHERRAGSLQNPYLKDKRWSALFQALQEAGTDRMQTGARMGWDAPGFFDTQNTSGANQQGRADLLQAMLLNEGRAEDARFVRGLR